MNAVRRALVVLAAAPLLLGSACGSETPQAPAEETVTIVGQKFTEADVMAQLYQLLLDQDGFRTEVEELGAREIYLGPLEDGEVQVAVDYLSAMTETLNRKANGEDAVPVATPDPDATLAQLTTLAKQYGVTPLKPTAAESGNGFAVTRAFAERHQLTTLSDLGRLGTPVALAASADCSERADCGRGLTSVYGITLSRIEPLGLGSAETIAAMTSGEVQLGQVGTTDGTLGARGVVVLEDDRSWQDAENLVPVVNSAWLADHPEAAAAIDRLAAVLTTQDLRALNARVDGEQRPAGEVAEEYLEQRGLL